MTTPDRLSPSNVRNVLSAFFDQHNQHSFPFIIDPARVEIGVAAPLLETKHEELCLCSHKYDSHYADKTSKIAGGPCVEGGGCGCLVFQNVIAFVGKLDIWATDRLTGEDVPVDHKTTGKLDARFVKQYRNDSQLSGYIWLLSQHAKVPVSKAYVNAIELALLPQSDRKCSKHKVSYEECWPEHTNFQVIGPIERTPRQIEEWKKTAINLALRYRRLLENNLANIHRVQTQGTFNGGCGNCEFIEWCLNDREVKQVPKQFAVEPWAPWDHANVKRDKWTFYVDNSTLKATATCDTQALMRYGFGHTSHEQSAPLSAGVAVHRAMEVWCSDGTAQAALAAFDEVYGGETE